MYLAIYLSHHGKTAWKQPISASIYNLIRPEGKLWKRQLIFKIKTLRYCLNIKKIRYIVRNETRQTDRFNQNEIAKACKDNHKSFWKYVKAKTKTREPIGDLNYINDNGEVMVAATDDSKAGV